MAHVLHVNLGLLHLALPRGNGMAALALISLNTYHAPNLHSRAPSGRRLGRILAYCTNELDPFGNHDRFPREQWVARLSVEAVTAARGKYSLTAYLRFAIFPRSQSTKNFLPSCLPSFCFPLPHSQPFNRYRSGSDFVPRTRASTSTIFLALDASRA